MDEKTNEAVEDAVAGLESLTGGDPEADHGTAEEILLQFLREIGHGDVAAAYEEARDRGRGWWYA